MEVLHGFSSHGFGLLVYLIVPNAAIRLPAFGMREQHVSALARGEVTHAAVRLGMARPGYKRVANGTTSC